MLLMAADQTPPALGWAQLHVALFKVVLVFFCSQQATKGVVSSYGRRDQ